MSEQDEGNNLDFSLEILLTFGEEILGELEMRRLKSTELALVFSLVDVHEKYFHMDGNNLWRVKGWRKSQENRAKLKDLLDKQRSIIFAREDALEALKLGAIIEFKLDRDSDFDDKLAHSLAVRILNNKNITGAKHLGVDLTNVPELEGELVVLDDKYGDYRLGEKK